MITSFCQNVRVHECPDRMENHSTKKIHRQQSIVNLGGILVCLHVLCFFLVLIHYVDITAGIQFEESRKFHWLQLLYFRDDFDVCRCNWKKFLGAGQTCMGKYSSSLIRHYTVSVNSLSTSPVSPLMQIDCPAICLGAYASL